MKQRYVRIAVVAAIRLKEDEQTQIEAEVALEDENPAMYKGGLWCKALIHNNVIDNEVMGWRNLLWKRNWIYLNGSNMNRQSFY
ncbi:hypothetical protein [Paenibacillus marchantiophytorum]|uniref:hypothetical protein n=1 Tax=Paenibacillus marchantiophytorum TaxID=1619310 RepID=UPI00166732D8|nr:hypothetical protein [Paenibacillus marchantiophytorum]